MTTPSPLTQEQMAKMSAEELQERYMAAQTRFGQAGLELQRRRGKKRLHIPAAEAPVVEAGPHQRMIVGPELGFDIYNFHIFTSGRAAGSDRYHQHGDAIKYYVAGGGYEILGDQRFEVKVGDFMHVPGNIWHGTENPNDEPLVFLASQQFPGTFRQVPTPFMHHESPHVPPVVKDLTEEEFAKLEPWPMYQFYLNEQMEFGKLALEVQRRREQKRLYVPAAEAPLMEWGPGRHLIIAPELGFDVYTFQVFMDHVPGNSDQAAYISIGETVKYYLEGSGVEHIDGQRIDVTKGDFLYVPAGASHRTQNTSAAPLRYLAWQQTPGTFRQVPSPFIQQA